MFSLNAPPFCVAFSVSVALVMVALAGMALRSNSSKARWLPSPSPWRSTIMLALLPKLVVAAPVLT